MSLIKICISDDFEVDYDRDRGMYRVSVFDDGHFWDEYWFDAYEEKEENNQERKLRKKIADAVDDKMDYMHCCPNERDTYLHIIAPDDYPRIKGIHCNTDCYNKDCKSYSVK